MASMRFRHLLAPSSGSSPGGELTTVMPSTSTRTSPVSPARRAALIAAVIFGYGEGRRSAIGLAAGIGVSRISLARRLEAMRSADFLDADSGTTVPADRLQSVCR